VSTADRSASAGIADRAFGEWLAWLPRWWPGQHDSVDICEICLVYVRRTGLDHLPHGVLHRLVDAVEEAIDRETAASVESGDVEQDRADAHRFAVFVLVASLIAERSRLVDRAIEAFIEPKIDAMVSTLMDEVDAL
jgi:hypothetical protein